LKTNHQKTLHSFSLSFFSSFWQNFVNKKKVDPQKQNVIENAFPLCSQSYCIFFLAKVRFFMCLARWRIALGDHQGLFFSSQFCEVGELVIPLQEKLAISWLQDKKKSRFFLNPYYVMVAWKIL
jgi:hypothetical protein